MPNCISNRSRSFPQRLIGRVVVTILLSAVWPASGQSADTGNASQACLHAAEILELARYIASTSGSPDTYTRVVKAAFESPRSDAINVTAFEENRSFVYVAAEIRTREGTASNGRPAEKSFSWMRRLIILNPSIFIVDDEILTPGSPGMSTGCISTQVAPQVSGHEAHITESTGEISSEILFPRNATYLVKRIGEDQGLNGYVLENAVPPNSPGARFLHVLHVGKHVQAGVVFQSAPTAATGQWKLTATSGDKVFRLTLPPLDKGAGEINISTLDGKSLVDSRPFPSGILPHGPEGNRLLELWDSDYQQTAPALWDIGRPADELQKVVAEGKVGRCRVVDMCCGSGSDAIYLASKGFDVTAIDVAPTALGQAQDKARKAGVSVQWILADILAPPRLQPFDFLYDRGCYHVVRDQNLTAYLETVRRFSRPGTQFLLLAARRDEQSSAEPSGVTEEELRFDFLTLFDVEWLREIRLESNRPGIGPPGWSAFLKRNGTP